MRKMIDVRCTGCGEEHLDVYIDLEVEGSFESDPRGNTHSCGAKMERTVNPQSTGYVHGDDIPGGVLIKHGLCWPDGTPRRFYSKTEIRKAEQESGWRNHVEHVPDRGSDKNRHTQKWV